LASHIAPTTPSFVALHELIGFLSDKSAARLAVSVNRLIHRHFELLPPLPRVVDEHDGGRLLGFKLPEQEAEFRTLVQALSDARYALGVFVVAAVSMYLASLPSDILADSPEN
jgi:hypothetical protein